MQIKIYICPRGDSYYGSSNMPALEEVVVGRAGSNFEPKPESDWFTRARCPACGQDRVPVSIEVAGFKLSRGT